MKTSLKWIWVAGGILTVGGPVLGVAGTVIGMMRSFQTLGASGVASPEKLSSDVSAALISTTVGIILGLVGLGLLLVGLILWLSRRNQASPPPLPPAPAAIGPAD